MTPAPASRRLWIVKRAFFPFNGATFWVPATICDQPPSTLRASPSICTWPIFPKTFETHTAGRHGKEIEGFKFKGVLQQFLGASHPPQRILGHKAHQRALPAGGNLAIFQFAG